jgi:hypothetical protein
VDVAGHVVAGSMELCVPMCAGKQDLLSSKCRIMDSGAKCRIHGLRIRSVEL